MTESSPTLADASSISRRIRKPIHILGSPRSGTTLLGDLLGAHPEIAYWEEPRTIWSQGNAWRREDRLEAGDLTPEIARRIDGRFGKFLEASGRPRFLEKTPSNTLRLPFVQALYPDGRVIHLVRDGRAVVASMREMLDTPPRPDRIAARVRETPWRDFLPLAKIFLQDLVQPRWRQGQKPFWGPRPEGWMDWLEIPVPTMLARQWAALVTTARRDLVACYPGEQRIEIRFEDFVADPVPALQSIGELTGLSLSEEFLEQAAASLERSRIDRWTETLDAEWVAAIEEEAGDLLSELGYELRGEKPER